MRVLQSGTLSDVTGGALISAVSSTPIVISQDNLKLENAMMWLSVEGDTGRTGGSVAVFWKGHYERTGASYTTLADPEILKSGTSIGGGVSSGTYLRAFTLAMPCVRVCAMASGAGSTQHGTSATNTTSVKWALAVS